MSDPKPWKADLTSTVVQDVRDAVRDLNDAIAVAAAHGILVELDFFKHHQVGEHVPRVIVEERIRKLP